jgi:membrane fusion protein (multidrug efflux system)
MTTARANQPVKGEAQVLQMPTTAEAPQNSPPASPASPSPAAAAPAAGPKKRSGSRRLMITVPAILVIAGGYFWLNGGRYEDTDNSYVQQPKLSLSADIAGKITDVAVQENQVVKKGDTLFSIDPATYKIALNQATAALAGAKLGVTQLRVAYQTAQTKLDADQQTLTIQQRAQQRNTDLATKGVATQSSVDQGALALQTAQSDVDQDKQGVLGALAALGGDVNVKTEDVPAVQQAQSAFDLATYNLVRTTVKSPEDGIITQVISLNVGQFVAPGTTIVNMVSTDDTWIEANFKETQLGQLKVGQPATVVVDSYPGTKLVGTVESVSPATGAEFSLIPAQNATGNWVKVVQRVPVRIKVTGNPEQPLRTGMSSTATVDTGKSTLDKLLGH